MNEKYVLGLVELDSQHCYFLTLLEKVEAVCAKHTEEGIELVLGELLRYAEFHFASEEALMAAYHYPSEGQKADHTQLMARVRSMLGDKDFRPSSLRLFLYNWITNHIDLEDRELAAFILKARKEVDARVRTILAGWGVPGQGAPHAKAEAQLGEQHNMDVPLQNPAESAMFAQPVDWLTQVALPPIICSHTEKHLCTPSVPAWHV
jgi:hemerythrin